VVITASSTDAVNGENLNKAFVEAQGKVRGMIDAALYETPADDATNVPPLVLGWAADIAWYLVMRGPRRPRLLEAYPEIEKAYLDTFGGIDSDLKRVAKGTFSLRGVLTYRGNLPPFTPAIELKPDDDEVSARPKIYSCGKGVF
jgi:hypothetical protein